MWKNFFTTCYDFFIIPASYRREGRVESEREEGRGKRGELRVRGESERGELMVERTEES